MTIKMENNSPFREARFGIGDVVRHRFLDFRGVVFDVDAEFSNSDDWYEAIPEKLRPSKDQPFYHLFAENEDSSYIAYVSQGNLLDDHDGGPVDHPEVGQYFAAWSGEKYALPASRRH